MASDPDRVPSTESSRRAKPVRDRAQFRPTAEQKAMLVRAAALTGQTISAFMCTAVEEKAQQVIADHDRIVVGERSRQAFFSALEHPPAPNDRLLELAERYAREVKSRS
jgi:uncharacterized protein (DUF1778 family)